MKGLACVGAAFRLVHALAYDPWGPEEILFVFLWMAGVAPALRALHHALCVLRRRDSPFDTAALGLAATPLRQLGYAFASLWVFDNSLVLAAHAGWVIDRAASPVLSGFPAATYFVWAGYALLHIQNVYFSRREAAGSSASAASATLQRVLALSTVGMTAAVASVAVGADPSTLVGLGGLLGFASSLAVKDTLTNLVSGISLAVHRPFAEGDEIVFGALNVFRVTARVVKLGYFQTVLRDAESCLIYVPNTALTNATISNAGRRTHTRVAGDFTLRASDAARLPTLLPALLSELARLPQLDESRERAAVTVGGFAKGGVQLSLVALFARGELGRDALRSAAWLAVARVVEREGCAFA